MPNAVELELSSPAGWRRRRRPLGVLSALVLAAALGACGAESSTSRDGATGASVLKGRVSDTKGVNISGARVQLGSQSVYSGADGMYAIDNPDSSKTSVTVTQNWFKDKTASVTINKAGVTALDITMEAWPLSIDPADRAVADAYNKTFNVAVDKVSISIVPSPTRKNLDDAVYYHNPALYRDTSAEKNITPSPAPTIDSGGAKNFSFIIGSGANQGVNALVATSIVDSIGQTPLTAAEQQDYMMFRPMLNWLLNWDTSLAKVADLNATRAAIENQTWGTNASNPQRLEKVFLHNSELWVKVVFEKFVTLGAGISDTDGDGLLEIYAKVDPKLYSNEVIGALTSQYIKPAFDAYGLSKELNALLKELYAVSAAEVQTFIGRPYSLPNAKGTITYPFCVLKHSKEAYNVLLVGP